MKSAKELVDNAMAEIETLTVDQAKGLVGDDSVAFIDIRETEELKAEGVVPGSTHAPRGLLEFFMDPGHPKHKPVFSSGKRIVFYCAGGVRSALATKTAKEMGMDNVCHVGGGMAAWKQASAPTEAYNP